jgi:mannose-6-phosphate isomerase-like protein (cupin superfamily)
MLEGRARIEVGEGDAMRVDEIGPGDACFFPRNVMHRFTVVSEQPVRVLIVYNPPYMERPENVRR